MDMIRVSLILIFLFSGCAAQSVVYKCPQGQVMVLEEGTTERCYTPGVKYYDYRPNTTKPIKKLRQVD